MSFSKVIYMSRAKAQVLKPDPHSCIISITSPGQAIVSLPQPEFENKIHRVQCSSAEFASEGAVFTMEMGADLAKFLKSLDSKYSQGHTLYVHCEHGEQRSASCALALAHFYGIPCFEQDFQQDTDSMTCPVIRIYAGVMTGLLELETD